MSKAAELAALIGSQTALSNRNLIINGGMTIAQRSVSETAQHTTGYITCDRFNISFTNEDELRQTITQAADGPSGFSKSLKLQTTTAESAVAADEAQRIIYRAEGQDLQSLGFGTSAAKKFTISFYVKSSVAATYGFNAYIYDAAKVFGQAYTINSANTWERKSITFDANTSDAITDDNTVGLQINWFLIAGSNYTSGSNSGWETFTQAKHAVGHTANAFGTTTNATWQITGVQLEIGEQATPFEHRSFHDEAQRCKRYYEVLTNYVYSCSYSNQSLGNFWFTVEKRTNCTLTADTNAGGLSLNWSPNSSGNRHGGYVYENPAGFNAVGGIRGDAEL